MRAFFLYCGKDFFGLFANNTEEKKIFAHYKSSLSGKTPYLQIQICRRKAFLCFYLQRVQAIHFLSSVL